MDAAAEPRSNPAGSRIDAPPDRPAPAEIRDVWSRREWRYRVRAAVFILINLALFTGLCIFSYWLREARLIDFSLGSYFAPASFWSADAPGLDDYLLEPISVERTPVHAVVLGLLFGALVTVPISIAILYRFPTSIPFLAAVFLFAHMPWMTVTLAGSCILAATRPFQLRFRYGAALMGLLPVSLYFLMASGRSGDAISATSPAQQTLLVSPWLLAILAAALMLAVILQFARLVNYRPGTVAPVVAVMFATPVALFHASVGVDELDYRVLESKYGPYSTRLAPVRDGRPMLRALLQRIVSDRELLQRHQEELFAPWRGEPIREPRKLVNYFTLDFMGARAEAYDAFQTFVLDHPNSPHYTTVLFLQARALDLRFDEQQMLAEDPVRELYDGFPHVQSRPIWEALRRRDDAPPELRAVAELRLAQLALRDGEPAAATRLLEEVMAAAPADRPAAHAEARLIVESIGLALPGVQREAGILLERIRANGADPQHGPTPLCAWSRLDPRRPSYRDELLRMIDRWPDALVGDNLLVEYARSAPHRAERRALLERLGERLRPGDALPIARYLLAGELLTEAAEPARRERAVELLRQVAAATEGVWSHAARDLLRIYAPAAVPPS